MDQELNYSEILQHFQRDINCLAEFDRHLRLTGLNNLNKSFFTSNYSNNDILKIFQSKMLKFLNICLSDTIEKHRLITLSLFEKFLEQAKVLPTAIDSDNIKEIAKNLCSRISSHPFKEQSEELRLLIIQLLYYLSKNFQDILIPVIDVIANTLANILQDQFPEIKTKTAELIILLSSQLKGVIGFHSKQIVISLSKNLTHQHQKIRKITIQALSKLILTDGAGQNLEYVNAYLKKIVNDKIVTVRLVTYQCLAWIINGLSISNLKAYETDLTLLLLNGLGDTEESIKAEVIELLNQVGQKRQELAIETNEEIQKANE